MFYKTFEVGLVNWYEFEPGHFILKTNKIDFPKMKYPYDSEGS